MPECHSSILLFDGTLKNPKLEPVLLINLDKEIQRVLEQEWSLVFGHHFRYKAPLQPLADNLEADSRAIYATHSVNYLQLVE